MDLDQVTGSGLR